MEVTPAIFEREIAPARTFVYYEDVKPLMDKNLIKGGSLENAIVVRGDAVLSKEPLRFDDEFVRHKILDIIGDLALVGRRIRGHIMAVKPGHATNADLARSIAREQTRRSAMGAPRAIPTGDGGLDTDEVMQILPHRYPFLMVDRILSFEGGNKMIGHKIGHDQRAVFSGTFSRSSSHAGRAASRSHGAGGQHSFVQTDEDLESYRLFHERGRREISQTGFAGRHHFHSRRADESARQTPGESEMPLRRKRRDRFRSRTDVHVPR